MGNSSLDWTKTLKALADESRLQIISVLLKGEISVNRLSEELGLRIYNVSRHLKILETSGLVRKRKEGNLRFYGITDKLKSRLSKDKQVLDLGCCQFKFKGFRK
jgi:DNA-binding transcriptional ArsR family regulator